jgi:hypothetical protein
MPRLKGKSKQVFEACCAEIHRMFNGEITEAELARRSVEIARQYGLDTKWAERCRPDRSVPLLVDLADDEGVRVNG